MTPQTPGPVGDESTLRITEAHALNEVSNHREEVAASGDTPAAAVPDTAQEPAVVPEQAAADAEGANGTAEADADGGDEESGDETAQTEGAAGPAGEKKKRRRRRKRKTGAAAEGGAAPRPAARPASERSPFHAGEEVFGRVTAVLDHAIMVDLSGKALAIFDRSEMEADDLVPAVGDRFVASVLRDGARGGLVVLTRKPLREEDVRPRVQEAFTSGTLVRGLITGTIKGGVDVSIQGLRAFAPASGMDLHPQNANFASLVGRELEFKIVQCDANVRDVVVTRRPMLEAEAHEKRKQALGLLREGQVLKGVIRTIVEWGAFVAMPEAGNLEGLVHASEASHDLKAKLTDLFKPGEELELKIIKIDERGKIWLSRKAMLEDPWSEARSKYAPGKTLTAKVTRVEPFGVFVKLDDDVEGLVHVSDLMASPRFGFKKIEHPNEVIAEGEDLDVVVHHFDLKNRKVSLHVALPEDKRAETPQRVTKTASLQVEVVRAESAGLIVRVLGVTGRSARGFVPAGQTGTARGTDLRKTFKVGTVLNTKVIDLDPRRLEPKLSIKQQEQDEERRAHKEYRKKLAKEASFGTLGDLLSQKLKQ
ncbi:MAG: S1 RNA-binding domain-containing protein [Polyangiaceae bacterium]